jgi:class 3 adenylate cyclase/hemoglobin-like flavoprotein
MPGRRRFGQPAIAGLQLSGLLRMARIANRRGGGCMAKVNYRDFVTRSVETSAEGLSLLDVSHAAGLPHFHQCNRQARCTTCRVRVLEGAPNLSVRRGEELQIATERGWSDDVRLGCQARVLGDVTIERLVRDEGAAAAIFPATTPLRRGEEKQVAIMFCDLRDFTRFAARHLPHDVIHILNRFLLAVCEPVLANRGYIDKYLGDGFLAIFGLEEADPQSCCLDAARAAMRMPRRVAELNRSLSAAFDVTLDFGVGLHFGEVVVGDTGHPLKTQFSVLGDTVNVASRIEGLNKRFGSRVLASSRFVSHVAPFLETGRRRRLKIANRWEVVHEILALSDRDRHWLVQRSFDRIREDSHRFGQLFYDALFRGHPGIEPLFARTDMVRMREMLLHMLGVAVQRIDDLDSLAETLRDLGGRHAGYGVQPEFYPEAHRAFATAIDAFFGEDATPDLHSGWREMLERITEHMRTVSPER